MPEMPSLVDSLHHCWRVKLDQNVEAGHFAARFIIQQSGCQLVKPCTFNFDVGKRALLLKD